MSVDFDMPLIIDRNDPIYPRESVRAVRATNCFDGSITQYREEFNGDYSFPAVVYLIDGSVEVKTVPDHIREKIFDHCSKDKGYWDGISFTEGLKGTAGVLGTMLGGVLALASSRIDTRNGSLFAVTALVSGIASSIFSGFYAYRHIKVASNANQMVQNAAECVRSWEDPVKRVIAQRKEAGLGFKIPHERGWKGSVVHSEELADLWLKDFNKLWERVLSVQNLHEGEREQGLRDFFEENKSIFDPKGFASVSDVLGHGHTFGRLRNIIQGCGDYARAYQELEGLVEGSIEDVRRVRCDAFHRLEKQHEQGMLSVLQTRVAALDRIANSYDKLIENCQEACDNAIEDIENRFVVSNGLSDPEFVEHMNNVREQEVERARGCLQDDLDKLEDERLRQQERVEDIYKRAKFHVDDWYEQQVQRIKDEASYEIMLIKKRKDQQIDRLVHSLSDLVRHGYAHDRHRTINGFFKSTWKPLIPFFNLPTMHWQQFDRGNNNDLRTERYWSRAEVPTSPYSPEWEGEQHVPNDFEASAPEWEEHYPGE